MPTVLGAIFFLVSAYYFLTDKRALFGVLIVASIFQASGAVRFGDRGVQCAYMVETFIILRAVVGRFAIGHSRAPLPRRGWLLAFLVIAVGSAFLSPILFRGVAVYDPLVGIDAGLLFRPPLVFGLNHVTQACFMLWHVMALYAALDLGFSSQTIRKAYLLAFYIALACVVAQAVCRVTGVTFPDFLVRNNPDIWDLTTSPSITRKPGTFIEPSFAGGFFVLYCSGFLAEYLAGDGSAKRVALALLGCAMVTSSGSLFSVVVIFVGLAFAYPAVRFPWHIHVRRAKKQLLIVLASLGPILAGLLLSGDLRESLLEQTVSKGDTGSFFNRTASDLYGLQLFASTHGIGVGLGSNRASSLVTTLLSTVGLAGTFCFFAFCVPLFRSLDREYLWLKWAAAGLLLNMVIDIPDVVFPLVWVVITMGVAATLEGKQRSQQGTAALKPAETPSVTGLMTAPTASA